MPNQPQKLRLPLANLSCPICWEDLTIFDKEDLFKHLRADAETYGEAIMADIETIREMSGEHCENCANSAYDEAKKFRKRS